MGRREIEERRKRGRGRRKIEERKEERKWGEEIKERKEERKWGILYLPAKAIYQFHMEAKSKYYSFLPLLPLPLPARKLTTVLLQ